MKTPIAARKAVTERTVKRRARMAMAGAAHADDIVAPLFDAGAGHVFALTGGQASQIDFILAGLRRMAPVERLSLWTWAVADYELEVMRSWLDAAASCQARLIVDRSCALRQPAFLRWVVENIGPDALRVTMTHAKIATIQSADGRVLTIRGSMNLNENPRCENVDICRTPEVFACVRDAEERLWREAPAVDTASLAHGSVSDAFVRVFGGECGRPDAQRDNAPVMDMDRIDELFG